MEPAQVGTIALLASFSGNGGVERMLVNLLHALAAHGLQLEVLLLRAESAYLSELPPHMPQHRLAGYHGLLAIPALAHYLRRVRPTALLVAKDRAGRGAVLARALARVNTPIVLRLGTHLSTAMAGRSAPERWLRFALIRALYPRIEAIVAVSAGVAQDVQTIAALPAGRVQVIRNPVITPALSERAAAPCPHPWLSADERIPVILGLGRLQRQKDFPTLMHAFARLRRERVARLVILGEGGGRAALERQRASLGLTTDIALPGFVTNPYPWLARANLFVLSSAWEGSPNALTEALALGTPVVATDCPSGPAEILHQGRYGPLVPVGDVPALASAMVQTLDHPLPPEQLRAAVVEYQAERSAEGYLAVLQRLSGRG